jgi:hypothetical protein
LQNGAHARVGDAVVDGGAVPARRHRPVLARPRQRLRDGGLREVQQHGQARERDLALGDQVAQQQQAAVIGQQAQHARGLAGLGLQPRDIGGRSCARAGGSRLAVCERRCPGPVLGMDWSGKSSA